MSSPGKAMVLLLMAAGLVLLTHVTGGSLRDWSRELVPDRVRLEAGIPQPATARLISLGHNEAAADLLWLHALGYFGAHVQTAVQQDEVDWLSPHIEASIAVDPRFRMIYVWAGTVPFYDQGGRERVELANRYLRQGIEVFPNDWRLHLMLGINLQVEMSPRDEDERRELHLEAMRHFRLAAASPSAPPTTMLMATTSERRLDGSTDQHLSLRSRILKVNNRLDALALRAESDQQQSAEETAQASVLRRVRLASSRHPWVPGTTPYAALAFHPEPILATPPEDLVRPHLVLTE